MNAKMKLGVNGEKFVCEYLKNRGYIVAETNYKGPYGEIDIICQSDEYIIFIEVKTRKNFYFSRGIEAVNKSKRIKIIKTAYMYLEKNQISKQPRFDVAELLADNSGKIKHISYYENSFSGEECDAFF